MISINKNISFTSFKLTNRAENILNPDQKSAFNEAVEVKPNLEMILNLENLGRVNLNLDVTDTDDFIQVSMQSGIKDTACHYLADFPINTDMPQVVRNSIAIAYEKTITGLGKLIK